MAVLVQVNSKNYSAQRRTFQTPQPLDPSVSAVRIALTRESWPGDTQTPLVEMGFEYSGDGGTTWIFAGSASFVGGVVLDRQGNPSLANTVTVSVPNVGQSGRLLRGFVDNAQNLTTAITVEAF